MKCRYTLTETGHNFKQMEIRFTMGIMDMNNILLYIITLEDIGEQIFMMDTRSGNPAKMK